MNPIEPGYPGEYWWGVIHESTASERPVRHRITVASASTGDASVAVMWLLFAGALMSTDFATVSPLIAPARATEISTVLVPVTLALLSALGKIVAGVIGVTAWVPLTRIGHKIFGLKMGWSGALTILVVIAVVGSAWRGYPMFQDWMFEVFPGAAGFEVIAFIVLTVVFFVNLNARGVGSIRSGMHGHMSTLVVSGDSEADGIRRAVAAATVTKPSLQRFTALETLEHEINAFERARLAKINSDQASRSQLLREELARRELAAAEDRRERHLAEGPL